MAMIGYVARVLTGVRFKKMNHMIDVVHQKCGQNKVRTFFDMLWCAVRYGAGYYDYTMFGFYDMTGAQRDTYLTRVRNKKVSNIMNDMAHDDDFDDKLLFNVRFAKYLRRPTLNGETATPLSDGQLMEKKIPGAGLVVLAGAGHFSFADRWPQCSRVLDSFLK